MRDFSSGLRHLVKRVTPSPSAPTGPVVLGVDIGSASVRLVEVESHGDGYRLATIARETLTSSVIQEGVIQDPDAAGEACHRAVRKARSRITRAALAVPASSVIKKRIQLPAGLSDREIGEQILASADEYIPYPIEEVRYDYRRLGPSETDEGAEDVLITASKAENVEGRVNAIEGAGLTCEAIDVDNNAAEHFANVTPWALPNNGEGRIAVVDIGFTGAHLVVLEEGRLVNARELSCGGRQFIEAASGKCDLGVEQIHADMDSGEALPPEVHDAGAAFADDLAKQCLRAIQMQRARNGRRLDAVGVTGGFAAVPGVVDAIGAKLSAEPSIIDPARSLGIGPKSSRGAGAAFGPSLFMATGLALRSFRSWHS